jgi:hypothetical protein
LAFRVHLHRFERTCLLKGLIMTNRLRQTIGPRVARAPRLIELEFGRATIGRARSRLTFENEGFK